MWWPRNPKSLSIKRSFAIFQCFAQDIQTFNIIQVRFLLTIFVNARITNFLIVMAEFICCHCGKKFRNVPLLRKHKKYVHEGKFDLVF
jgi:hypothetical protein